MDYAHHPVHVTTAVDLGKNFGNTRYMLSSRSRPRILPMGEKHGAYFAFTEPADESADQLMVSWIFVLSMLECQAGGGAWSGYANA